MSFAQYKSREDILAHIRELEDIHVMWGNIDKSKKKIRKHLQFIQELRKMAEDFSS